MGRNGEMSGIEIHDEKPTKNQWKVKLKKSNDYSVSVKLRTEYQMLAGNIDDTASLLYN